MSIIAEKLAQAHKLNASACGKLSVMLTRKGLSPRALAQCETEMRQALEIVSSLMPSKGK